MPKWLPFVFSAPSWFCETISTHIPYQSSSSFRSFPCHEILFTNPRRASLQGLPALLMVNRYQIQVDDASWSIKTSTSRQQKGFFLVAVRLTNGSDPHMTHTLTPDFTQYCDFPLSYPKEMSNYWIWSPIALGQHRNSTKTSRWDERRDDIQQQGMWSTQK